MAMTNKQTIAAFIRGERVDGRNGNNTIFFRDNLIFSYGEHFPMARKTGERDKGERQILLMNSRDYSATTAKHKSLVRYAVLGEFRVLEVPHILSPIYDNEHAANEAHLIAERDKAFGKYCRARSENMKDVWHREYSKLNADLSIYRREFMGI